MNSTKKQTYSPSQQALLISVFEILQEKGGAATLDEIYEAMPAKIGCDLDEQTAKDLLALMQTSSSDSCIFMPGTTSCMYINDQGNGEYRLEQNAQAVYNGKDDASASQKGNVTGVMEAVKEEKPEVPESSAQAEAVTEAYVGADAASAQGKEAILEDEQNMAQDAAYAKAEEDAAKYDEQQAEVDQIEEEEDQDLILARAKVQEEKEKIARHQQQMTNDRTGFMKKIHEMEIHHDERVIAKEQAEIDAIEAEQE